MNRLDLQFLGNVYVTCKEKRENYIYYIFQCNEKKLAKFLFYYF